MTIVMIVETTEGARGASVADIRQRMMHGGTITVGVGTGRSE
jgi:hypothetical protein